MHERRGGVIDASSAKRVLFVVNEAAFFVSHRLPLALAARDAGFDVHVALPVAPPAAAVREAGLPLHDIPVNRGGMNPLQELRLLVALTRLYRRLRPDLVHHVTVKPVLYGSLVAQWLRVPAVVNAVPGLGYIFLARGATAGMRRSIIRGLYVRAFSHPNLRVVFQNPDDMGRFLAEQTVRPDQVSLVRGSGVDLQQFRSHELPAAEPPLVVLGARMLVDKGVREYVAAARLLRARGVAVRMALVGDVDPYNPAGISSGELEAWATEGAVEWWGRRGDMPEVLAEASIACLPSYREGLPKFLLEAAASGRPIVTTDVPGCREVVAHGENGLLVPPRDHEGLADAIQTLVRDPGLRAGMGGASRLRAEREFGIEQVVAATLTIYRELLAAA